MLEAGSAFRSAFKPSQVLVNNSYLSLRVLWLVPAAALLWFESFFLPSPLPSPAAGRWLSLKKAPEEPRNTRGFGCTKPRVYPWPPGAAAAGCQRGADDARLLRMPPASPGDRRLQRVPSSALPAASMALRSRRK